jgi:SAM-dependent methyltransferase
MRSASSRALHSVSDAEATRLLAPVERYYTAKLREHGSTARGVDWNGESSQRLRFEQLERVVAGSDFSLNDLGCGYGAFLTFLRPRYSAFAYRGIDLSAEMIAAARAMHRADPQASFHVGHACDRPADYSVASGIFNVRVKADDQRWLRFILQTIERINACSTRGFAFNCLSRYSDADKMQSHLYYADPCLLFDHCKTRYSKNVALLHDYGLYEFTLLVRKDL